MKQRTLIFQGVLFLGQDAQRALGKRKHFHLTRIDCYRRDPVHQLSDGCYGLLAVGNAAGQNDLVDLALQSDALAGNLFGHLEVIGI